MQMKQFLLNLKTKETSMDTVLGSCAASLPQHSNLQNIGLCSGEGSQNNSNDEEVPGSNLLSEAIPALIQEFSGVFSAVEQQTFPVCNIIYSQRESQLHSINTGQTHHELEGDMKNCTGSCAKHRNVSNGNVKKRGILRCRNRIVKAAAPEPQDKIFAPLNFLVDSPCLCSIKKTSTIGTGSFKFSSGAGDKCDADGLLASSDSRSVQESVCLPEQNLPAKLSFLPAPAALPISIDTKEAGLELQTSPKPVTYETNNYSAPQESLFFVDGNESNTDNLCGLTGLAAGHSAVSWLENYDVCSHQPVRSDDLQQVGADYMGSSTQSVSADDCCASAAG